MLVWKKKRALLLKLREPERVLNILSTAKRVKSNGVDYVAVPHRLDETRTLRGLGHDAPSPIRYYYGWPGRYTPFSAQKDAEEHSAEKVSEYVRYCVNSPKPLRTLVGCAEKKTCHNIVRYDTSVFEAILDHRITEPLPTS